MQPPSAFLLVALAFGKIEHRSDRYSETVLSFITIAITRILCQWRVRVVFDTSKNLPWIAIWSWPSQHRSKHFGWFGFCYCNLTNWNVPQTRDGVCHLFFAKPGISNVIRCVCESSVVPKASIWIMEVGFHTRLQNIECCERVFCLGSIEVSPSWWVLDYNLCADRSVIWEGTKSSKSELDFFF